MDDFPKFVFAFVVVMLILSWCSNDPHPACTDECQGCCHESND